MITTTPTIAIRAIADYAIAISDDTASDSTLDDMQFDIDCMLFPDDLPLDLIECADYTPLTTIDDAPHLAADSLTAIRALAIAAFNMRP